MNAPLYLAKSGLVSDGLFYTGGDYWSSTANNSETARTLTLISIAVDPEGSIYRYRGVSLRCVLREFLIVSPKAQPTADQVSASVDILA